MQGPDCPFLKKDSGPPIEPNRGAQDDKTYQVSFQLNRVIQTVVKFIVVWFVINKNPPK